MNTRLEGFLVPELQIVPRLHVPNFVLIRPLVAECQAIPNLCLKKHCSLLPRPSGGSPIIACYFPVSDRNHVILLAEDRIEGEEKSIYNWHIDSNYDPGSILDFELQFQKQE